MRLTECILVEQEQLPERVDREVALGVFFLVDDTRGQCLFVGLSLEDLLFDGPGADETIDEAYDMRSAAEVMNATVMAHILSSGRHATLGQVLAGQRPDSSL